MLGLVSIRGFVVVDDAVVGGGAVVFITLGAAVMPEAIIDELFISGLNGLGLELVVGGARVLVKTRSELVVVVEVFARLALLFVQPFRMVAPRVESIDDVLLV